LTANVGFIGGTILANILSRSDSSQFAITAVVRSEEKAQKLKSTGVNAILGELDSVALLEEEASKSDIIISAVRSL
jgi:putative NADH-flavin reductase